MKTTIPNSNTVFLNGREWLIVLGVFIAISLVVYNGFNRWERIPVETDFRSTCWEARMSDYYAYSQWANYARDHYKILLIGDSVIWGQEVPNNETVSHFINQQLGKEEVANLGIDGLTLAALDGMVANYGSAFRNTNAIVELNPLWMSSPKRDMREKGNFHHPRLVPQFDPRIKYFKDFNERLGYVIEHHLKVPPFVRHLMVNYYDNKSVANWLLENPYRNPLSAITFQGPSMMKEKQGLGTDWASREKDPAKIELRDDPFLNPDESVMFEHFLRALDKLKKHNVNAMVLLGPFNTYNLNPESRQKLFTMIGQIKQILDKRGVTYFDATCDLLPSTAYADQCHALASGHAQLAEAMVKDPKVQRWLATVK